MYVESEKCEERCGSMQKIQLICFPYAGGSAAFFYGLKEELQDQIEVTAAEYAGHGTRRKESYYHTFDELVQDMTDMVREVRNPEIPYAMLGYSMGSVVAYEVWKAYRKQGWELPVHMFVASHRPPHLPLQGNLNADSSEEEVIEALCNFGGMDPRLLENKRFLNLFIRPVKVDYGLLLQYQAAEVPEKVTCDLTAFYASEDLTEEEVCQWQGYTEGEFAQYEFHGNHFFLKENEKPVGDVIREKLLALCEKVG